MPRFDAITEGLAPGSPILVGMERAGCACFLRVGRKGPFLLTCGHVFPPGSDGMSVYASDGSTPIAELSHNLLETLPQIDAALCLLTEEGIELVHQQFHEESARSFCGYYLQELRFTHRDKLLFWPTHEDQHRTLTTSPAEFPASTSFSGYPWANLPLEGLLKTPRISRPGDSGSLLSYYHEDSEQFIYAGLCSGGDSHSYFTPISAAMEHIQQLWNKEVSLWLPR